MSIIGNILWLVFGGLEAALSYFAAGVVWCCTIVGIPFGLQCFKLGMLCIWPFGSEVRESAGAGGCLTMLAGLLWLVFVGIWAFIGQVFIGLLLCITVIGIPFGRQHFKIARLALFPFGKEVVGRV